MCVRFVIEILYNFAIQLFELIYNMTGFVGIFFVLIPSNNDDDDDLLTRLLFEFKTIVY